MIIIVGLGNPGKKFQKTRHNLGFMAIDNLQLTIEKFSDWKNIKKLQAKISKGEINSQKVLLAKPLTFMNLSGKSVKTLITTRPGRVEIKDLWVIHDDIDLPLGKIRIVKNRGSAGHKGVKSIIKESGTKNFVRFRIGIQPKFGKPKNPEKFVLQKFNKGEEKIVEEVVKKTAEAIEITFKKGLGTAMNEFNK